MRWRRRGYCRSAGRRRELGLPFGRGCLLAVGIRSSHGSCCLGLWSAYGEPLSQSSVARLAARAHQLCDPGEHPGRPRPPG